MAKGMTGSRCQPARAPVGGERTAYWLPARAPVGGERTAASQTSFTDSESDVRDSEAVRGGPLQGDFWSRIRLWKAVAEGITGSRCQPARGLVGGERSAPWSVANNPRRLRHGRRLEALLKARKRKKGRARRCFTDLFYGFRKRR